MASSSNVSEEVKRSDFGSLKRVLSTTASSSKDSDEMGRDEHDVTRLKSSEEKSSSVKDVDELKSKVGSKKSITTVGSSTIVPSETLNSNVGSLRKPLVRKYPPSRRSNFSISSKFVLKDSTNASMEFRRFDRANARRLLALEAEIAELEKRLEELEVESEKNAPLGSLKFERERGRRLEREREEEMAELGRRLDTKIEKYYTAVSQTIQMSGLPQPITNVRDSEAVVRSLSALFAIIFLVTAIVVLYFITKPVGRLGALCGFTIVFAIALITLTNARRHEVFVATAAYAAVLVVFISGNLAANINNMYSTTPQATPQADSAPLPSATQTVVQIQTQTVTAAGSVLQTATVTAIQTAVTTIFPSTCPSSTFCAITPSPSATSSAAKGSLQGLPVGAKVGIGFLLAVVGLLGISWVTSFFLGVFGCFFSGSKWLPCGLAEQEE